MRVAALYDIHGNLPALEAVLEELRQANVDQVVVGGDVVPGPMPRETLQLLLDLDLPVHFLHGNGELAMLALLAAPYEGEVSYWVPPRASRSPNSIARSIVGRRSSFSRTTGLQLSRTKAWRHTSE